MFCLTTEMVILKRSRGVFGRRSLQIPLQKTPRAQEELDFRFWMFFRSFCGQYPLQSTYIKTNIIVCIWLWSSSNIPERISEIPEILAQGINQHWCTDEFEWKILFWSLKSTSDIQTHDFLELKATDLQKQRAKWVKNTFPELDLLCIDVDWYEDDQVWIFLKSVQRAKNGTTYNFPRRYEQVFNVVAMLIALQYLGITDRCWTGYLF